MILFITRNNISKRNIDNNFANYMASDKILLVFQTTCINYCSLNCMHFVRKRNRLVRKQ